MSEMKCFVLFSYIFCLLKLTNGICEPCENKFEEYIRNTVMEGIRSKSIFKRQITESSDNSSKVFSTTDQIVTKQPSTTESDNDENCHCNFEDIIRDSILKNINSEDLNKQNQTMLERLLLQKTPAKPLNEAKRSAGASADNETNFELERESQTIRSNKEAILCPYYKKVPPLNIAKMADVWELVYYKAKAKLMCFRVHIKKTTRESRKFYENVFSSFGDTVNWQECELELSATGKKEKQARKHFLQVGQDKSAILENVIISIDFEEKKQGETKVITLEEQTPDQWLVHKNLLLMRDCDNGEVVIFSRLPSSPDQMDFVEAMNLFGEDGMSGTVECDDGREPEIIQEPYLHIKYDILS